MDMMDSHVPYEEESKESKEKTLMECSQKLSCTDFVMEPDVHLVMQR
jgi:hypothetical protein